MASAAYGGINGSAGGSYGGTGGKFRKKPFRKPQTTPYDRPPTAVRPTQSINNSNNNGGWLSKIVDPASKLITAGAHKLFSSVFRKRLLPPPQQSPVMVEEEPTEIKYEQPELATNVVMSSDNIPVDSRGNNVILPSDSNGVADLEDILKQKTFTRSEIDHLTALLLSRTVEDLDGAEEGGSEPNLSDVHAVHARHDKLPTFPARENRLEYLQSAGVSTPEVRSKVVPDDIASPAEIAKAYMGSRPSKVSPSVLRLQSQLPKVDLLPQSQLPKEELSAPSNPLSKSLSPINSITQKHVSDNRTSSNGFTTPRFRGRSAIYSMARTPYSRFHPVTTSKVASANPHSGDGSSYLNATENNSSQKQALKRRSSVLENDIGSVGPIRRIRQKPNLLHPKTLSLPPAGRQVSHMSGVLADAAEASSSMAQSSRPLSKLMADHSLPSTSTGYVPSQSIEMAQKIFEQLDKFSPKKNVEVSVGISPSKTPCSANSLKSLQSSQDNPEYVGSGNSLNARNHQPQTSSYEVSAKKIASLSASVGPQDAVEGRKSGPYSSSKIQAVDFVTSVSVVNRPHKQRAFQMSAHEECLDMDDEMPSSEVVLPTPSTEEGQHAKTPRKTVTFSDIHPRDQAIEAEKLPVMKPTEHIGKNELKSQANGSSTSVTTASIQPSLTSLSSPASSAPQSIMKSDKVASQDETSSIFPSVSSKSNNLPSFVFGSPSSANDTKPATPISLAAEVNGSDKADSNSTPVFGNTANNSAGQHSVAVLSNGSQANNATPVDGVISTFPAKADASSPASFTISSNNQNLFPASSSSPSSSASFMVSNGSTQPLLTPSTSTPATSSVANLPGAVTAPPFTFASGFPSPSRTLSTSASENTDKSGTKLPVVGLDYAASEGKNISTSTAQNLKKTDGESNKIAFSFQSGGTPDSGSASSFLGQSAPSVSTPASTPTLSFGGQSASSASAPASTSTLSFGGQSASSVSAPMSTPAFSFGGQPASSVSAPASTSALSFGQSASSVSAPAFSFGVQSASSSSAPASVSAPSFPGLAASSALVPASTAAPSSNASPSAFIFGSSGSTGSSSGSVFGSVSNPFGSGSGTASSVMGASGSTSTAFTFGITSQSTKSTPTTAVASSPAPVFSFGAGANSGTVFGATTSSPAFGTSTSSPAFGAAASSPAFGAAASSPAFGAATSSPAFGATASSPAFGTTASSSVFGASTSSPAFGATSSSLFGATVSSSASNSTPFVFGGNSALAASSPATMSTPFPSQPAFGNATGQPFAFGSNPSTNNDQVTMEDTMAEDSLQSSTPAAPAFGAPLATPSGGFAFNAAPAAANPFQFNTQPSQVTPQNPSFQPSGSLEFNGGTNSFSLGTSDKSQRRIVRVKKGPRRK